MTTMDYPVRTAAQLAPLLKAFRASRKLTQSDLAERLGVTQQALSALEREPQAASFERLLSVLSVLGVEIVLRDASTRGKTQSSGEW